jgi:hypothetical protein
MKFLNKKGITTRDWVLAGLMFGAVFSLGIILMSAYSAESGANIVDSNIEGHYNQLSNSLYGINQSINALSQPGGFTLTGTLSVFYSAMTTVLNIVFSSIAFVPTLFANFGNDFGIPTVVTNIFFAVVVAGLTVLIIFAILNASKLAGRA